MHIIGMMQWPPAHSPAEGLLHLLTARRWLPALGGGASRGGGLELGVRLAAVSAARRPGRLLTQRLHHVSGAMVHPPPTNLLHQSLYRLLLL